MKLWSARASKNYRWVAPSRRERGLKCPVRIRARCTAPRRSLSQGAWIEIAVKDWRSLGFIVAPSRRERGLKFRSCKSRRPSPSRSLSQGAWIEIMGGHGDRCSPRSRSLSQGAWIEISSLIQSARIRRGRSLSQGAWIEIAALYARLPHKSVAPSRRERGLKSAGSWQRPQKRCRSLSQGAWIEIAAENVTAPARGGRSLSQGAWIEMPSPCLGGRVSVVAPPRGERGLKYWR